MILRIALLSLLSCRCVIAQDVIPLEVELLTIDVSKTEVRANATDGELPPEIDTSGLEGPDWLDEVGRLRSEGYDVRLRRIRLTAYEGLPAMAEFAVDRSQPDDERNDGEREQSVLDISCLLQKAEEGSYVLEYSIQSEDRLETPWELELLGRPSTDGGPPPEMTNARATVTLTPDEWTRVSRSAGTSSEFIRGVGATVRKDCTIMLARLAEPLPEFVETE